MTRFIPSNMKASPEVLAEALKQKSLASAVTEVAKHLRQKYEDELEALLDIVAIRRATKLVAKELDLHLED